MNIKPIVCALLMLPTVTGSAAEKTAGVCSIKLLDNRTHQIFETDNLVVGDGARASIDASEFGLDSCSISITNSIVILECTLDGKSFGAIGTIQVGEKRVIFADLVYAIDQEARLMVHGTCVPQRQSDI